PLGILFSYVLHTFGAARVIAIDQVDRSDVAASFGVTEPVWGSSYHWARELGAEERPELVVEAVGRQADTLNDAITALADGGEILAFGVPTAEWYAMAFHRLFRRNGTLVSGTVRPFRVSLVQAADYLASHLDLAERYFTHNCAVEQARAAYELASVPAPGRLKVGLHC
ncbi:MAG: zinc-binding dehydrogenase, partial [Actinomycetota bacterium]|nr:zinc-binding dehydrogenase [Actinomycetota bacterium]